MSNNFFNKKEQINHINASQVFTSTTLHSDILHSVTGLSLYVSIASILFKVSSPSITWLQHKEEDKNYVQEDNGSLVHHDK